MAIAVSHHSALPETKEQLPPPYSAMERTWYIHPLSGVAWQEAAKMKFYF